MVSVPYGVLDCDRFVVGGLVRPFLLGLCVVRFRAFYCHQECSFFLVVWPERVSVCVMRRLCVFARPWVFILGSMGLCCVKLACVGIVGRMVGCVTVRLLVVFGVWRLG